MRRELPRHLPRTSAAVLATAVIGSLGTDVRSGWYRNLEKPAWQPPGAAFGPAWTTLYGLLSLASARALDRTEDPRKRRAFAAAFGTNLALNASWNWLFFKARRPRWALAEILLLEASTIDLTRRAGRADPTRRHDARALRRLGRLRHRPQRRHRPAKPRPLTPDQHKGRRQPTRKGHP